MAQPAIQNYPAPLIDMNALDALYQMRNRLDVDRFLQKHPDLMPLLEQAATEIRCVFGLDVPLVLKVAYEPTGGASDTEIVVYILLDIHDDAAWNEGEHKLRLLQSGWWRDHLRQAQGFMSIELESLHGV